MRTTRGHDGAAGHLGAVGERGHQVPGDVVERRHRARAGEDRPELLGLDGRPRRQVLAGDPGREAQVVLDAGAGGRLAPDGEGVDGEGSEALGRPVDRRRQPGRAGPHDQQVEAPLGQGVGRQAELEREVAGGGPLERCRAG